MQERYRSHWHALKPLRSPDGYAPSVSILIAARNEAHRILPTLKALGRLTYAGQLEILILDDHSTDGTADLVQSHLPRHAQVLKPQGTGKRAAWIAGLEVAKGEIILFTDADCVFGSDWVEVMVQPFAQPGIHWVSGPVVSIPSAGSVSRYDALEWQGLMVITGAAFGLGHPVLAQGANIAIRRSRLDQLADWPALPPRASGDDVFLLSLFHQEDPFSCHFQKDASALIQTAAPESWSALLQQRLRWTSKSGHMSIWHGLAPMALTWMTCLAILATPILALCLPAQLKVLAFLPILIKGMADYHLLRAGWLFSNSRFTWMDVVIASLIQPLTVVISGLIGPLRPTYLWKGRRVQ